MSRQLGRGPCVRPLLPVRVVPLQRDRGGGGVGEDRGVGSLELERGGEGGQGGKGKGGEVGEEGVGGGGGGGYEG